MSNPLTFVSHSNCEWKAEDMRLLGNGPISLQECEEECIKLGKKCGGLEFSIKNLKTYHYFLCPVSFFFFSKYFNHYHPINDLDSNALVFPWKTYTF